MCCVPLRRLHVEKVRTQFLSLRHPQAESNCNPTFSAFSSAVIMNRPKFLGWPAGQRSVAALFPIIYRRLASWALHSAGYLRGILTILEARRFHEQDAHHPL